MKKKEHALDVFQATTYQLNHNFSNTWFPDLHKGANNTFRTQGELWKWDISVHSEGLLLLPI